MSHQLKKIYARLPPWIAEEAGRALNQKLVTAAVTEVVRQFQAETGTRVVAATVHVENSRDIHIHLVFTSAIPSQSEVAKYGPDYLRKLLGKQRKAVKAILIEQGVSKPNRRQTDAELERLWEAGELDNPKEGKRTYYESLQLPKAKRRSLKSMGPAYCSKTNLWEADNRSSRVAQINEQRFHPRSFDAVVVSALGRISPKTGKPEGLGDIYIDHWLTKRWMDAIWARLPIYSRTRSLALKTAYVNRYIKDGSSLPNPSLDAARRKVAAENADQLKFIEEREKAVVLREQAAKREQADNIAAATAAAELKRLAAEKFMFAVNAKKTVADAAQKLQAEKIAFAEKIEAHQKSVAHVTAERNALRRIPIEELCVKLGFELDEEGNFRFEVQEANIVRPYQIRTQGQSFRLEIFNLGNRKWEHLDSSVTGVKGTKGAIDLLLSIPLPVAPGTTDVPKRTFAEACETLAVLFPDYLPGLALEFVEHRTRQSRSNNPLPLGSLVVNKEEPKIST